jgi:hypothetical protein
VEDDLDLGADLEHVQHERGQREELSDPLDRLDREARHLDLRELEGVLETHPPSF